MAKSPSPDILTAIRSAIPASPHRVPAWWQKLPPELLQELEHLRAEWYAGRQPGSKSAVAKAISDELVRRGLSDVGRQGVTKWLNDGKPSEKR